MTAGDGSGSVAGTGIEAEVSSKYAADFEAADPGRGKHLWVMFTTHRVVDPEAVVGGVMHLDNESLLSVDGPGCFKCEQVWSPELARRWCSGVLTARQTG